MNMGNGPGKYADLTTYVREKAQAGVAMVIIIGGNKGQGFDIQCDMRRVPLTPLAVANILRDVAKEIEKIENFNKNKDFID